MRGIPTLVRTLLTMLIYETHLKATSRKQSPTQLAKSAALKSSNKGRAEEGQYQQPPYHHPHPLTLSRTGSQTLTSHTNTQTEQNRHTEQGEREPTEDWSRSKPRKQGDLPQSKASKVERPPSKTSQKVNQSTQSLPLSRPEFAAPRNKNCGEQSFLEQGSLIESLPLKRRGKQGCGLQHTRSPPNRPNRVMEGYNPRRQSPKARCVHPSRGHAGQKQGPAATRANRAL